jgi:hypothetical protein
MAILRRATSASSGTIVAAPASDPYQAAADGFTRRLPATSEPSALADRLRNLERRLERLERGPRLSYVTGWGSSSPRANPNDAPPGSLALDTDTGNLWIRIDVGWAIITQL